MRLSYFFFNDTATTEIYTLSLHDALPILVGVELVLLLGGDRAVVVDARGALDLVLVVGHDDVVATCIGGLQRDEGLLRAEQAGLHGDPGRIAGAVVQVDLADAAELLPGGGNYVPAGACKRAQLVGGDGHARV